MTSLTSPEQLVAIFEVNGRCSVVGRTVDYIYGLWLPNSEYTRADGDDYELFDDRYDFDKSNSPSKYVIPVRLK